MVLDPTNAAELGRSTGATATQMGAEYGQLMVFHALQGSE